jgi:phosphatidylglycerophosphatase A
MHFLALGGGGDKDPAPIVCDEVIGFAFAAYLLPFTPANIILIFILFRFFDILKPYPAGLIDSRLEGGAGIVLDDVVAGVYANAAAHIILRFVTI